MHRIAEGTAFTGEQVRRIIDRRAFYAGVMAAHPAIISASGHCGLFVGSDGCRFFADTDLDPVTS